MNEWRWSEIQKNRQPLFDVTKIEQEHFFSTSKLEKDIANCKVSIDGNKIEWLKINWIQLQKGNPKQIRIEYTHSEDMPFTTVDVSRKYQGTEGIR